MNVEMQLGSMKGDIKLLASFTDFFPLLNWISVNVGYVGTNSFFLLEREHRG